MKIHSLKFRAPVIITAQLHQLLEPFGTLDFSCSIDSGLKGKYYSFSLRKAKQVKLETLHAVVESLAYDATRDIRPVESNEPEDLIDPIWYNLRTLCRHDTHTFEERWLALEGKDSLDMKLEYMLVLAIQATGSSVDAVTLEEGSWRAKGGPTTRLTAMPP